MEIVFDISQDELPIFLAEVDEQLQVLDEHLVEIEQVCDNTSLLQDLFRAAHTIKGMAGMIGHNRMMHLTHELETLFDALRKGTMQFSTALIDLCLDAVDGLRFLREEVNSGVVCSQDIDRIIVGLKNQTGQAHPPAEKSSLSSEIDQQSAQVDNLTDCSNHVTVRARILPTSVASAARAFQVMLALQEHGEILSLLPDLEQIDTAAPVHEVIAVLATADTAEEISRSLSQISEIENFTISSPLCEDTGANPEKKTDSRSPVATGMKIPNADAPVKDQVRSREHRGDMTVRTTVERLDILMNLVGELITDRNHLYQIRNKINGSFATNNGDDQFSETIAHLGRITDQLQESVMRIRMLPIGNVLSKFPRMVRDLSQKTGKLVDLVIEGEDTEMDRSMIEEINDPLIHLVRNSIDHGIELPEERVKAGKSERGTVRLTARYEQGRIVLSIEDDGAGIDAEKVRNSAVEKGLISREEANAKSDEQSVELIFLPGLSTVKQVSDISGRGVGMDIVHNNIQHVNGMIQVETKVGKGTTFHITLPLTLAIIPTLMIRVASTVYAIPLVMVSETLRILRKDVQTINGNAVTVVRGNILPLLELAELFHYPIDADPQKFFYVVVVNSGKTRVGIIVDALQGEEEVVVKSLGPIIGDVPGISSAAILGDGSVALIIDVPGLLKIAGIN